MRGRDLVAVLLGLAVVGAVAYGGWWWLQDTLGTSGTTDPAAAEPGDTAEATFAAYLDAWAALDHVTMRELVRDPPPDMIARHDQLVEAWEPTALRVSPGELDDTVDGRARLPVRVAVELPELADPVRWEVELIAERQGGRWGLVWTLASLHPELRPTWGFGTEVEDLDRAPILAADGTPLAGDGTQVTFGFEPSGVSDAAAVVAAFEAAVPGSGAVAERELGRDGLVDGWFYPVVTVSPERASEAREALRDVPGILRQEQTGRTLYRDDFARHLVGVVAEATAEQLEELGEPYTVGDEVGQFGLEQAFESGLAFASIVRVGLIDGVDGPLREVLLETAPTGIGPIATTIDIPVQQAVENALVGVGQPAAIVVVDATDGAIRGSASRPLTGFNRAWSGRYPPGSTFKVVTAEAALAAGFTPATSLACPPETTVGGLRVPNAGARDLGLTDLTGAFAASCNTTFAELGAELGADAMAAAAARFGFGAEYPLPLAAFRGSYPEPADTAELAAAAFGQARVEASPLHLASVAAATISGRWHPPYLLTDDGPGAPVALADGVVGPLTELLVTAVEDGTGEAAVVEGEVVGGKTGTAQGTDGLNHAWFIGTWEGYGFAVLVEDGGFGGEVAAPIAGRLVRELAALLGGPTTPSEPGDDPDGDEPDGDG